MLPEFLRRVGAVLDGIGGTARSCWSTTARATRTWQVMTEAAAPRPAHRRGAADAQPRPSAGAHRRPHGVPRRAHPDHRRRPAGPARAPARHDGADGPGRRRGLRPAPPARRREPVQARDRRRLLSPDRPHDRRRDPARCRRLPPDDAARARPAAGHARAPPLHPRHGGVDRRPAGADALRSQGARGGREQVSAGQDDPLRRRRHHRLLGGAADGLDDHRLGHGGGRLRLLRLFDRRLAARASTCPAGRR